MSEKELEKLIAEGIPDTVHVAVHDMTGTGDHWEVEVVSGAFEGKSLVQQHKMVYDAVGDHMTREIHALSIKTLTPSQWKNKEGP